MTTPTDFVSKLQSSAGPPGGKFLSSRRGTIAAAALTAAAALGVLLLFMSNYRDSVESGATETKVLVADRFIEQGTSGDVIAEAGLFEPQTILEEDALDGALTDPSALAGHYVTEDVYRGQQLTTGALAGGSDPVAGKLEGVQRAISVPVDSARGNVEQIDPGSHVDVVASYSAQLGSGRAGSTVEVLARDVLILEVPDSSGSAPGQEEDKAVVMRVDDVQATRIAHGADNGDIWLLVRPPTLGEDSPAGEVNYAGGGGISLLGALGG